MMDPETLAQSMSLTVRRYRLERAGILPPSGVGRDIERQRILDDVVGWRSLPDIDRQNWIDCATAALEILEKGE